MTVAAAPPVNFDMGRVMSAGFGLLARRPLPILLLALVLAFLPRIVVGWASLHLVGAAPQPGAVPDWGSTFERIAILEAIAFVAAGVAWVLQGGVALVATADAAGRSEEIGALLTRELGSAPVIFIAGVAGALGIFLAALLFIVPGVLLSLAWSVSAAVGAVEREGFIGMFRRSAELTRGCRGALFGIALIFLVAAGLLGLALRLALGVPLLARGDAEPAVLTFVFEPLLSAVFAALVASVNAAAYLELRGVKEGLAADGLAAMLD